jgi:hypothetical protein
MPTLRAGDFRAGEPVELALRFTNAKSVKGAFGRQAMFTTSRGALYLDPEPASDIETQVRDLAIAPGEMIRVMRMRKPDGGDGWEVQRVEATLEEQLVKSLEAQGRDRQAAGAESPETASAVSENKAAAANLTAAQDDSQQHSGNPPAVPVIAAGTLKLMACFMQAIDAVTEAQVYCARKGLGITFTSEDVRATAISCYINCSREGR